jgi:hypothetical protein
MKAQDRKTAEKRAEADPAGFLSALFIEKQTEDHINSR